ncbi:RodZ domain-containing protein [Pandoraea sp.]|uniref:helix-turn-helix domain-containing protein n=1 Tax=Pandoraea sp. TaxID=1883445 RepID=UPI00121C008B|nr:RodZ domain-containing protein [Pandoraea sp.]TAL54782.1 MAG: helix-turn-helix domain-containing protein [Pandoraea sp.]TAM18450.1 MAG: helix-turn-helix domain-containing protein [Pandoraea sp.]
MDSQDRPDERSVSQVSSRLQSGSGGDAPANAPQPGSLLEVASRIGRELKEAREQRGLLIEDVSARLKVSASKLKALEGGQWEHLPEMPFVQGLVRGYARLLEVDPAPMTEALRPFGRRAAIDIPPPSPNAPSIPRSPARFRSPVGNAAGPRLAWVVIIIIALGVAILWFGSRRHSEREASASVASAPAAQGGGDAASEGVASDSPAGQQTVAGSVASVVMPSTQNASPALASVVQTPASEPVTKQADTAAAVSVPDAASSTQVQTGQLRLQLSGDSWVEVRQSDGKVVFSRLLHAGDQQDIAGTPPLKVVIGNTAGVASLQYDNQPVDVKTRGNGNVARLTLP